MEVQLTPEQEAQLAQIATKAGTDAERLAKDAVLRLLEGDAGFRPVSPGSVVAEMRALRARVKPDPEGWTTRDYVNYGRPFMRGRRSAATRCEHEALSCPRGAAEPSPEPRVRPT